jgi:hypothetical protein
VHVKFHDLYRWIVVARTGVVGQFDCGGGFPLVSECRRRIFGKIARGNDNGLKTASAFRELLKGCSQRNFEVVQSTRSVGRVQLTGANTGELPPPVASPGPVREGAQLARA